jgi:hypothetical protein
MKSRSEGDNWAAGITWTERKAAAMRRVWRLPLVVFVLTLAPMHVAWAAWVLWVEAPVGSDQWSIAGTSASKFTAKDECERHALKLNEFEATIAKMERMTGDSRDVFTCLPDTVDPRPEGALR